ncbi:DUF2500 domain-containing protein [Paenibacillus solani]|uniref:DUF2500 domain-containing protein n=1 Tax=Paenibacillus solani TaxID=1705565 RepID=A0A0M1N398_9BACL|nr:DUF2500 domain-containing protein [Paenibacillus solani]KOR76657.1 hypothetical protein AM231_22175 [Paenibacillus solani]
MMPQGPSFGGGFDFMFTLVPIIIGIGFVVVIGGLIFNGARYVKNAKSPRTSEYARVVSKRMDVRHNTNHHNDNNGMMHSSNSSRTYYYITLEFDNGERKEFLDVKNLYGLVVEGDTGYAAIQGDWIVAFEREMQQPL